MMFLDHIGNLEGKLVVYKQGTTYGGTRQSIRKITKETKTGFRIENHDGLFEKTTGYQRGLTGKMNIGTISECRLISKKEAKELQEKWKQKAEIQKIRVRIKELINTKNYDYKTLKAIQNILEKKQK